MDGDLSANRATVFVCLGLVELHEWAPIDNNEVTVFEKGERIEAGVGRVLRVDVTA